MATSVDMALDDIISKNRLKGRGRGRARRGQGPRRPFSGGRMPGAVRRGPLSVNSRPSLNAISKTSRRIGSLPWQHDLLEDSIRAAGVTGIEVGTKLYISNLDYGVSNEDIRELFSEVGELKRYAVHYDKNGRSSGSAEVVYTRRSDAFAALKKYNNVLLDGKPMRIEILGAMEMAISAQMNVTGVNGRQKRTAVMMPGAGRVRGPIAANRGSGLSHRGGLSNGGARGRAPGRGRGRAPGRGRGHAAGRGRGRGRGKKQPIEKSADELDKDLENYHAEAMQS